ncbi:hypothetical protein HDV05_008433 [Chytridiales sp. JEL 0842]|nr:hypothetical protein HDV05_008433 [Chytridiales sp. JEL 0842]
MSTNIWPCVACTFINTKPEGLTCEICETPRPTNPQPESLDPDDEADDDAELELALKLSRDEAIASRSQPSTEPFSPQHDQHSKPTKTEPPISPLDSQEDTDSFRKFREERAAMEKERVERLKKRGLEGPEADTNQYASKQQRSANSEGLDHGAPRWLEGHTGLTYVVGYSRAGYLTFEELVQKDRLERAFLSGMVVDPQWLLSKLPTNKNIYIAMQKPKGETVDSVRITDNVIAIFPRMGPGYGCMHIKLMVLWFPKFVRVVITSSNLVHYDWEILENNLFVQDFPEVGASMKHKNQFETDLVSVLTEMGAPAQVIGRLGNYDFTKAKGHLVMSKPGSHKNTDLNRWGMERLATVVEEVGREIPVTDLTLTYATSSLGSLNANFLGQLVQAMAPTESVSSEDISEKEVIQILFPTAKTQAGTITWAKKFWYDQACCKHVLHDIRSKRKGSLSHCKIIVAEKAGWYYCGSHNATQAAWGTLNDRKTILKINNWELGIVLPFSDSQCPYEIPFERPPTKYASTDTPHWNGM